jgi:hypothetical protein
MPINYDKEEVRSQLTRENIFELMDELGGNPSYSSGCIISDTICHNLPGEGSHKLYYYFNSELYICFTGGCEEHTFDVFDLVRKVAKIQWGKNFDLNDSIRWICQRFGILGTEQEEEVQKSPDWDLLANYERIQELKKERRSPEIILKEYDDTILKNLNYNLIITPWRQEGISQQAIELNRIGYFLGGDQITIPHFDRNNRFIGLRGRTLCQEDADRFGKYRPLKVNNIQYNHPLGYNLYNLNFSKDNIKKMGKAVVFESEKSTLQYKSYFGAENDISVACCGSNISAYQIKLLLDAGVKEVVVALDRQFQEIGDKEFKHLTSSLIRLNERYKNYVNISFIFDKHMITDYKASPTDQGPETFLQLYKERIIL